ncbi:DUF2252 domain-containing protein [Microbacterium sp. M3]|uniref:DUF2252 domain-containing protein n=1 Tax=Microbacterium arthrosphaerae TaxID=792652 RepID=A0ABU4H5X1_9MICO|nr:MULTISPECIES: DUF2252 domain-containing protein [Microbacterium]MDW4574117.1 DUF2252 domain-containing protein [Microbacterium arthrosphaerae]MDW7607972.1 DUF2252 domain-containing protein [Microbacterium sp. M3]
MSESVGAAPATWTPPASVADRLAEGRAARQRTPRSNLSRLNGGARDPLGILDRQNATRVPELVPLRIERMSASPFAFYRGTAALQAADLANDPHSGILVPSCGDAHIANFGFYASPQRTLVFDLNDFDEAAWAPWEWDVKRLVASIVIGGQATSRDDRVIEDAALAAVRTYARAMDANAGRSPLLRFFEHFDVTAFADAADKQTRDVLRAAMHDAEKRTAERATRRLTETLADGRMAFIERPPMMVHVDAETQGRINENLSRYADSANIDIRVLLNHYTVSDLARRVVGVGSVGTVCALVLLQDGDGHPLLLQAKQAGESVLVEYGGIEQPDQAVSYIGKHGHGGRVVALQRILQAVSDPFLGHLQAPAGDFYVRQFHDMKGSVEAESIEDAPFGAYAQACAATLARAHSQSPQAATVAGYIGNGRVVGEAILEWAYAYAALSKADYDAFVAAHQDAPTAA